MQQLGRCCIRRKSDADPNTWKDCGESSNENVQWQQHVAKHRHRIDPSQPWNSVMGGSSGRRKVLASSIRRAGALDPHSRRASRRCDHRRSTDWTDTPCAVNVCICGQRQREKGGGSRGPGWNRRQKYTRRRMAPTRTTGAGFCFAATFGQEPTG